MCGQGHPPDLMQRSWQQRRWRRGRRRGRRRRGRKRRRRSGIHIHLLSPWRRNFSRYEKATVVRVDATQVHRDPATDLPYQHLPIIHGTDVENEPHTPRCLFFSAVIVRNQPKRDVRVWWHPVSRTLQDHVREPHDVSRHVTFERLRCATALNTIVHPEDHYIIYDYASQRVPILLWMGSRLYEKSKSHTPFTSPAFDIQQPQPRPAPSQVAHRVHVHSTSVATISSSSCPIQRVSIAMGSGARARSSSSHSSCSSCSTDSRRHCC